MTGALKSLGKSILRRLGYDVVPYHPHLPRLWSKEPDFQAIHDVMRARTLVPPERCFALWQLARNARHRDGAIAEIGVFRGGTAKLLASVCPDKPLHLFDTFEGMPDTDPEVDRHRKGDFADTSLEAVKAFLAGHANVHYHQGFFPATAGPVADEKFALVYSDVDIYQSIKDCLEFFYPRMVTGGAIVFDDYEASNCPGVRKAIDEFLADKPERPLVTARYQCAIFKL